MIWRPSNFDYVIVDMPTTIVQWTETVLSASHVYLAPLELDMRSAQNTLRHGPRAEGRGSACRKAALRPEPGTEVHRPVRQKPGQADGRKPGHRRSTCRCPMAASPWCKAAIMACRLAETAAKNPLAQGNPETRRVDPQAQCGKGESRDRRSKGRSPMFARYKKSEAAQAKPVSAASSAPKPAQTPTEAAHASTAQPRTQRQPAASRHARGQGTQAPERLSRDQGRAAQATAGQPEPCRA